MTKKLLIPSVLLILVSQILLVTPAFAATTTTTPKQNFFSGLANFIAQKFNLDQGTVQSAVKTYMQQNKPSPRPTPTADQIQAMEKTRLDKLVSSGKITSDQETLIIAEDATLRAKYNSADFKSETAAQRKQQMTNEQADIKAWATANNINAQYLMLGGFGRGMMGMHRGFGNWKPSPSPTP